MVKKQKEKKPDFVDVWLDFFDKTKEQRANRKSNEDIFDLGNPKCVNLKVTSISKNLPFGPDENQLAYDAGIRDERERVLNKILHNMNDHIIIFHQERFIKPEAIEDIIQDIRNEGSQ